MVDIRSKKGFYLVSPFLGFFFFIIAVNVGLTIFTENNQRIETAKGAAEHDLVFITYSIQSDAFDVYFQNYLQGVLDDHIIAPTSVAIRTQIIDSVRGALANDINATYSELYQKAFNISCNSVDRAHSTVILRFTGSGADVLGTGKQFGINPVSGRPETAIFPYASRYGLFCEFDEPPMTVTADFTSRWYYLDATNICTQSPSACA